MTKILNCGHKPSPGTAHTSDGEEICYKCANKRELADMLKGKKYTGYLDGDKVTTWPGGLLGKVWSKKDTYRFGNKMVYFQFHAPDGSSWWGLGMGDGMYANLYRYK